MSTVSGIVTANIAETLRRIILKATVSWRSWTSSVQTARSRSTLFLLCFSLWWSYLDYVSSPS